MSPDRFSAERTTSGWAVRDANAEFDATLRELYPVESRQVARRMAVELNEQWRRMPKSKVSFTPSV